jgi:hypothetical protein
MDEPVQAVESVADATQTSSPDVKPSEGTVPEKDFSPEQAKAFQEMRVKNKTLEDELKSLKSERENRAERSSAMERIVPQKSVRVEPTPSVNNFVNKETGEFDAQGYDNAMNARIQSLEANLAAERSRNDEELAKTLHPELDPNSDKYDAAFDREVAKEWTFEMMNGKNVTFQQIANRLKAERNKASKAQQVADEKDSKESLAKKEQASMDVSAQTSSSARQEMNAEEYARLRQLTRESKGDSNLAVAARLSKIPWKNKG